MRVNLDLLCGLAAALVLAACSEDDPVSPPTRDAMVPIPGPVETGCVADEDCSDGRFCNGDEVCLADGSCADGEPPACDDGVVCTDDTCDEALGACRHAAPDVDGDGHPDARCVDGDGTMLGDDCDDDDPTRYPGNTEVCDAADHDEDCNVETFGEQDNDGDGHLNANCCNVSEGGERHCGDDCDDANVASFPGNTEVCDAIDNDCNGLLDHPIEDVDGDGFATTSCGGNDCDDHNPAIYAGAKEICDGQDSDCSGGGGADPTEVDLDTDGYVVGQCIATDVLAPGDCDDTRRAQHVDAPEVCNGQDDDCDTLIDEDAGDCGRGIFALAARFQNSMAVHVDGTVSVWGNNNLGFTQTGATLSIPRPQPVPDPREPSGLLSNVASLGIGNSHACAVHQDGRASCWGYGLGGRLGNGSAEDVLFPPTDIGLENIVQVTAGQTHGCALDASGALFCWGTNFYGQVGDGSDTPRLRPVPVEGLDDVVAVAAGWYFTCAVRRGGQVDCWGQNEDGQLGDTTKNDRLRPARVFGIDDATGIATGSHTACAIHADRTVSCWGSNEAGQQGSEELVDALKPGKILDVSGRPLAGVVELAVTGDRPTSLGLELGAACARLTDGQVKCWGSNRRGQHGIGVTDYYDPVDPYLGGSAFAQYAALTQAPATWEELETLPKLRASGLVGGRGHLCAIDEAGVAYCWGNNTNSELGHDGAQYYPEPVEDLR